MDNTKNENIKDEFKKKVNEIDNQIDNEKNKIKKINNVHEMVTALKKNLNKCIELLSVSINGKQKNKMLNDMYDKNKSFYMNFSSSLDNKISITKNKINKLNETKDILIKEHEEKNDECDCI